MKYLIPVFILIFLILPNISFGWNPVGINPGCGALTGNYSSKLCNLLVSIKNILLAIGFLFGLIMIMYGGISYMTAGGDDEKAKKARKIITNGVIGFAIIIASAFIIGLVNEFINSTLLN
ncbi:hypothetical protein KKA23_03040 [Patescibacteria group bacterium]|nr:hypothetical protein [Patescibacteria group bacterium]MBU2564528.1 hypothetical protein [Patescibacteria group bacterium]